MEVIAHREVARLAPENTLATLHACIEQGISWAEVDVRRTRDGHHVLMHDERVERTTTGSGRVAELTLVELQRFDAGSWFSVRYTGLRVPTLREALELTRGRLGLYLDCREVEPAGLFDEIRAAAVPGGVMAVFEPPLDPGMGEQIPDGVRLVVYWDATSGSLSELAERTGCSIVEIGAPAVTAELVAEAHGMSLAVECVTLRQHDAREWWLRCRDAGADWIMTDKPLEARDAVAG
ncbi:MAG: glycerophosphoryl diester phosphodiesterase [Planctomycetes bacterium]|nr:glycerophosphoryl diester phosphodiesterase [Planctomycetota bacterium]